MWNGSLLVLVALASRPAPAGSPTAVTPGAAVHREALRQVGGRSFTAFGDSMVEVRTASVYCLGCHDGTVAREAFRVTRAGEGVPPPGGRGHPVDVPYPVRKDGFRPAATLDPRLSLSGGCVSCVTCHGGDDPSRKRLSIPNDRSALCLCCHVK